MSTAPTQHQFGPTLLTEDQVEHRLKEIRVALTSNDFGRDIRPDLLSLVGLVDATMFRAKCHSEAIDNLTARIAALEAAGADKARTGAGNSPIAPRTHPVRG